MSAHWCHGTVEMVFKGISGGREIGPVPVGKHVYCCVGVTIGMRRRERGRRITRSGRAAC